MGLFVFVSKLLQIKWIKLHYSKKAIKLLQIKWHKSE